MDWIKKAAGFVAKWAPLGTVIIVPCAVITVIFTVANPFLSEAIIEGSLTKYSYKNIISYGGKLLNTTYTHADKFIVKGQFDHAEVIDLKIQTMDTIENSTYGTPKEIVEFSLKRLSRKGKCFFDILIQPKGEVRERIQISWGKTGYLELLPNKVDEDTARSIERGIDLSLKERQKWLRDNLKNIR